MSMPDRRLSSSRRFQTCSKVFLTATRFPRPNDAVRLSQLAAISRSLAVYASAAATNAGQIEKLLELCLKNSSVASSALDVRFCTAAGGTFRSDRYRWI